MPIHGAPAKISRPFQRGEVELQPQETLSFDPERRRAVIHLGRATSTLTSIELQIMRVPTTPPSTATESRGRQPKAPRPRTSSMDLTATVFGRTQGGRHFSGVVDGLSVRGYNNQVNIMQCRPVRAGGDLRNAGIILPGKPAMQKTDLDLRLEESTTAFNRALFEEIGAYALPSFEVDAGVEPGHREPNVVIGNTADPSDPTPLHITLK